MSTRLPAHKLRARQVDLPRLYEAFAAACRAAPGGRHSPTGIGERLGVGCGTLSRMKSGAYRNVHAVVVLRMCAWAGLDPLDFLR